VSDTFSVPSPGAPLWFGSPGDPLVLLVHDYFGRLPGLSDFAAALAKEGFYVAVPDLYDGVATQSPRRAEDLMDQLDVGIALAELDDVLAIASVQGSPRVGIVGFSMGGWLALLCAQGGAADAVVVYYATLGAADHGVVPTPLLLHYAETDSWGPGEEPANFVERLVEHGTPVTEHVYLGTGHSFANADIASTFNKRAAELAKARTIRFLVSHLVADE
jgi:carboxymethylenebutenolidase